MIHVCHMTSAHASDDTRIFYKECVSLAKAVYEVSLVARGPAREEAGVRVVGVGVPSGGRLFRMLFFARRIYRQALALDAEVYHLHDPELLPYGLRLKRRGKVVIFDSHEFTAQAILEKHWLPKPLRRIVYRLYQAYEASVCRRLDAVISVSPHIVDYFSKINPRTVQVTNYPIFREAPMPDDGGDARIIFAGGITPQWMHETVLKALEKVPECRYTLCGPVGEAYLSRLEALPGWAQTDYLGRIPHGEVAKQMAHCRAGVALLRPGKNTNGHSGTMGNTKIFEEMMAGLPVICTDFSLWREFVERYHCGVCVDPEDVDQVVLALRRLLEHPEEARQMGENGRRAVREAFNWSVEEQTLLGLYRDLSGSCDKGR